jgi:hypothetical protein
MLFGSTVSKTSVVELHFDVEEEEGGGYLTLTKVLPDEPVEWCAHCGDKEENDRLCDSCCAQEEYSCCGTDFLPTELVHGLDKNGTFVVRGRFIYTRDYWGEFDSEFEIESTKFTEAA